jgi:hypothetical protein
MKLTKAAERTSRHPIRSTILGASAIVVKAAIALAASSNSALAASSLNNGNFEHDNPFWRKGR